MAPYKRLCSARRPVAGSAARASRPAAKGPLSGAIIDAVLHYADMQEDQGCGRTLLRLSPRRLAEAKLRDTLGPNLDRARGVSILWNDREGEILRVFDRPAGLMS